LTVFSVFVQDVFETLQCANVQMFSKTGFQHVANVSSWVGTVPTLLFAALLAALLAVFGLAARTDARRSRWWTEDLYFRGQARQETTMRRTLTSVDVRILTMFRGGGGFLKKMCTPASLHVIALDFLATERFKASLTRRTCFSSGTLDEIVLDEVGKAEGSRKSASSRLQKASSSSFFRLYCQIHESMPSVAREVEDSGVLAAFRDFFWYSHPLCIIASIDVQTSCKRKASSLANSILGSLSVSALFFQVSGGTMSKGSPDHCAEPHNLTRVATVGTLSTFVAMLPCFMTVILAKRTVINRAWGREQRAAFLGSWRRRNAAGWLCDLVSLAAWLLISLCFLANIRHDDHWKWAVAYISILLRWMLLMPALMALFPALTCQCLACFQPDWFKQSRRWSRAGWDFETPSAGDDGEPDVITGSIRDAGAADGRRHYDEQVRVSV